MGDVKFRFLTVFCLVCCGSEIFGACPKIISRTEWHALPAKSRTNLSQNPPPFVVVHHSDTASCNTVAQCTSSVQNIQRYHMNTNGWADIGYNFLIGGDGSIYEGRGWGIWGAHVPLYNARSLGVCLLGTFTSHAPTTAQLNSLHELIACAQSTNQLTKNYSLIGHRQGGATTCPGNSLFNIIKTWPHFNPHPS